MEEVRKEIEETVVEQRPSTKYGRTAYQQQLKEEQAALEAEGRNSQMDCQEEFCQQSFTPYEEPKPEFKKNYVYILMILVAISSIIAFISSMMAAEAYTMGNTIEEVIEATTVIASQSSYRMLTMISDIVFMATVLFLSLDMVQIRNAGKKITGGILFAIFLRPVYFIWRAHVLGEKKTVPILYTTAVYLVAVAEIFFVMQGAMEMVMRTM